MKGNYIVWDTATGVYDGAYVLKETAILRYEKMSKDSPRGGGWCVVQLVHPDYTKLADEKFHANQHITQE